MARPRISRKVNELPTVGCSLGCSSTLCWAVQGRPANSVRPSCTDLDGSNPSC